MVIFIFALALAVCLGPTSVMIGYVLAAIASKVALNNSSSSTTSKGSESAARQALSMRARLGPVFGGLVRYMSIRSGKIPIHQVRMWLLRRVFLMNIAENAVIYMGYEFRHPHKIRIGKGAIIGNDAMLDGRFGIHIGESVNLSSGVWIWTEQHDPNDPDFGTKKGRVTVGDRAWVSSRVTLLPGVTVGEGAVIAAGAVVVKDCEPYGIYGGIPAKKIGERRKDIKYIFDGSAAAFY